MHVSKEASWPIFAPKTKVEERMKREEVSASEILYLIIDFFYRTLKIPQLVGQMHIDLVTRGPKIGVVHTNNNDKFIMHVGETQKKQIKKRKDRETKE